MGNHVVCVDIDERKIALLNEGGIPIHEPGLETSVQRNAAGGRLQFTTDIAVAVGHGTMVLIGVGTPPDEDGAADLQHVLAAARSIGTHMTDYKVVVDKSTVPVGIRSALKQPLIFDVRNLFEPATVKDLGIEYCAIGRGDSMHSVLPLESASAQ
jgi:UDPglucose 6-dehydrogenase